MNTLLVSIATRAGAPVFRVDPPQTSCQTRRGFTLIELLVVISIIGILSSALVVSVKSGYKQARQANCKSNLRQFGVALTIYRGEHDNRTPDWISNLYPEYVDDRAMYVCRADKNGGTDRPRPDALMKLIGGTDEITKPFWDNRQNTDSSRNEAIACCSYLYEFSNAKAPSKWRAANQSTSSDYRMRDYKMDQMLYGDNSNMIKGKVMPYSASRIPIVRCYHHWHDQKVFCWVSTTGSATKKDPITINVAYAGNVFVGPTEWEKTIHPGETRD